MFSEQGDSALIQRPPVAFTLYVSFDTYDLRLGLGHPGGIVESEKVLDGKKGCTVTEGLTRSRSGGLRPGIDFGSFVGSLGRMGDATGAQCGPGFHVIRRVIQNRRNAVVRVQRLVQYKLHGFHGDLVANRILVANLQVVVEEVLDSLGPIVPVHTFRAVGLGPFGISTVNMSGRELIWERDLRVGLGVDQHHDSFTIKHA